MKWDVAVFGGGLAGVSAAVNAMRIGRKVILIEHSFSVGGNATLGLVNPFMRYWIDEKILTRGFFKELLNELENMGGRKLNSFDSEILKLILFRKLKGVDLLFRSIPIKVRRRRNRIESVDVINSLGEEIEIEAKLFIDATGDATLSYLAGTPVFSGDERGRNQAVTLMFTIANVDFEKVRQSIEEDKSNFFAWVSSTAEILSVAGYFKEIERARKDGLDYPNDYFFFVELPNGNRVTVNTTQLFVDTTDPFQLSQAMAELHEQVHVVYEFARKYVPGFENSFIEKIAPLLGIRESRRAKGKYVFRKEDVLKKRKFPDGVVKACYGIDVHSEGQDLEKEKSSIPKYEDYYEIPLRAFISDEIENLAFVGRNFSSDFYGHSAARIMPTCVDMGEVMGKLCGAVNESFHELFGRDINTILGEVLE